MLVPIISVKKKASQKIWLVKVSLRTGFQSYHSDFLNPFFPAVLPED